MDELYKYYWDFTEVFKERTPLTIRFISEDKIQVSRGNIKQFYDSNWKRLPDSIERYSEGFIQAIIFIIGKEIRLEMKANYRDPGLLIAFNENHDPFKIRGVLIYQ